MKTKLIIALLAACGLASAQREEIETTASIREVMVYTSAADVSYEKELLLRKGKSTIVFTELTPYIADNSVNVSVSDAAVTILTVNERINYTKEKRVENMQLAGLKDSVEKMKKELGLIAWRREVAEKEKSILFKDESIGGLTKGVAVAEIEKASSFFSRRYAELAKELYYLNERESELQYRIKKYESQLKESVTVSTTNTSEIIVSVNCPSERKVKFNFRFLTPKAGWAPMYDFKYEGPARPLQFVFRANVFNATGTPWNEVYMKLSTADPTHGFSLPSLSQSASHNNRKNEGSVQFRQVTLINAITEYNIAHQYSIPSDSKPYLIDVSALEMPAQFSYLLIPKLDPFGFLMGKVPDWNKYNLIPGSANIYNMGSYMGKTFLDTYAENDTLSIYLGKDKSIQSTRTEKNINHERMFIGNYFTDETQVAFTVKNNFSEALNVEVIDQVPVYDKNDEEKLTVNNITNAVYDKAQGKLTWTFKLQPAESVSVNFSYEVKAPKEYYDAYKPKKKKFRTISCPAF